VAAPTDGGNATLQMEKSQPFEHKTRDGAETPTCARLCTVELEGRKTPRVAQTPTRLVRRLGFDILCAPMTTLVTTPSPGRTLVSPNDDLPSLLHRAT
jgi:hypothetical protein